MARRDFQVVPESDLDLAIRAARAAGEILREGFRQPHSIRMKGPSDPVTEIDQAAEDCIIRFLKDATPGYGFLSEETGTIQGNTDARWIIDPLDGTVNYTRGFPRFCTSIALERSGELEVGVVYDPLRDDLFAAQLDRGATLNGQSIRVTTTDSLASSVIGTGFPYDAWTSRRDNTEQVAYFVKRTLGVRSTGSAALDLAAVAAGQLDAHWEYGLAPYDMAAGILLVRQAGGIVSDYEGHPNALYGMGIIAANRTVHTEMLAYFKSSLKAS